MSNAKQKLLEATLARAICCPDGNCHTEAIKKREDGKHLVDLPCYALGPDVRESVRAVIAVLKAEGLHAGLPEAEGRRTTTPQVA